MSDRQGYQNLQENLERRELPELDSVCYGTNTSLQSYSGPPQQFQYSVYSQAGQPGS